MYIVKREFGLGLGTAYFSGYVFLEKTGVVVCDFSFSRGDAIVFENYNDALHARKRWGKGAQVREIQLKEIINEEV